MENEYLKKMVIARCKTILIIGEVRVFRFADTYTVKDKYSGDKIFEIKTAEYCDSGHENNTNCECLVVDRMKFVITENDTKLLAMVKEFYDNQDKNVAKEKTDSTNQPSVLNFLDKYIHR